MQESSINNVQPKQKSNSEQMPIDTTSSNTIAKPYVGCSASHSDTGMRNIDNGLIFYCLDCWKEWRYKMFEQKPNTIEGLHIEIDAECMAIKFNMSRGKSKPKTKQELIKMMDDYNEYLGYVCYDYKS